MHWWLPSVLLRKAGAAKAGAKAAHAAAQDGADRGENAKTMDALEIAADAAERRARTAGRLLEAAQKKREAGELTRDSEIRQSYSKAMNQALRGSSPSVLRHLMRSRGSMRSRASTLKSTRSFGRWLTRRKSAPRI